MTGPANGVENLPHPRFELGENETSLATQPGEKRAARQRRRREAPSRKTTGWKWRAWPGPSDESTCYHYDPNSVRTRVHYHPFNHGACPPEQSRQENPNDRQQTAA